ncbi:MAG TPA: Gfo/Idh/MocA family oxidoreductase [Chthonomonadaceae bacterium]|nr:Gfo/Idh/MocA family oxidoreductase [Chthonomonadaceae bacterium]
MRKVKWGVLGCAAFARNTAIPAMQQAEGVELTAIASRTREKAEAFQQLFGFQKAYGAYEDLLADPEVEAIYNPLPNGMHPEWTIKVAQAGKHSLVEKPFAANVSEAEEVAKVVREHGVHVMEAFMWRFHPMHRRARQLVCEGAIGPLRLFRTAFTFNITRGPNVRLDAELAGGGLMDVGCYCVSEARFFFDAEPVRVYARADYDPEYKVDMLACGVLEFPNGGRATFDCGFELPYRCDYEISGSKGRIVCPNAILPGDNAELRLDIAGQSTTETFPSINQWSLEFEHLSRCIVEGTPLDYDTADAIKQQRVLDAIYRSTRSGQAETV